VGVKWPERDAELLILKIRLERFLHKKRDIVPIIGIFPMKHSLARCSKCITGDFASYNDMYVHLLHQQVYCCEANYIADRFLIARNLILAGVVPLIPFCFMVQF
jgi:hypothetical protein